MFKLSIDGFTLCNCRVLVHLSYKVQLSRLTSFFVKTPRSANIQPIWLHLFGSSLMADHNNGCDLCSVELMSLPTTLLTMSFVAFVTMVQSKHHPFTICSLPESWQPAFSVLSRVTETYHPRWLWLGTSPVQSRPVMPADWTLRPGQAAGTRFNQVSNMGWLR